MIIRVVPIGVDFVLLKRLLLLFTGLNNVFTLKLNHE